MLPADAPVVVDVSISRRVESPEIDDVAIADDEVAEKVKGETIEEVAIREEVGEVEKEAEATEAEDRNEVASSVVPSRVLPGVNPELLVNSRR